MARSDLLTGIEWVVACLTPSDIAPHPNFRVDSVSPVELFALLVELEVAEFDDYLDRLDSGKDFARGASAELLSAARESLGSETQRQAMNRLLELAQSPEPPLGIRVAAVLLGAVAASELDELDLAVDALKRLHEPMHVYATNSNASAKLLGAVLAQQLAVRLLELGEIDQAYRYADEAFQTLNLKGMELWDEFPVSRGIAWDSRQSQARAAELIRGNAMSARAFLADDSSNEWIDVVRSPAPSSETRPLRTTLRGLTTLIDEKFRERFEVGGSSRTLRIGGDPVLQPLYAALMHAELAGSLSEIGKLRELIGQTLMLRSLDEDLGASVAEAIRLLRQSDSETSLKRLLRSIRIHGPIEVIGDAGSRLLATKAPTMSVSQADLYLIEAAADLLPVPLKSKAIAVALAYPSTKSDRRLGQAASARWKKLEDSLRVVATLLPESNADDFTARQVLAWLKDFGVEKNSLTFSAAVKVAEAVRWGRVSNKVLHGWRQWISDLGEYADAGKLDFLRLAEVLDAPLNLAEILAPEGPEYVTWVVNRKLSGKHVSSTELSMSIEICARYLLEDVERADRGVIEGHLYSPAELSAYLIAKCDATELWDPLVKFLINPGVAAWDKVSALNRLAYSPLVIPDAIRAMILEGQPTILRTRGAARFGPKVNMLPSAWRKFALANGLISLSSAQMDIITDAASRYTELRSAAAESAAFFSDRSPEADWPAVLLLQLSQDQDSSVRAAAARNLAYISSRASVTQIVVQERVHQLLFEPGVGLPMAILRGLLRSAEQQSGNSENGFWWTSHVMGLVQSHPSSLIRANASRLLSSTSRPGGEDNNE
ncbi:hypothetical protein [Microbispora sp. H11081]|uniref:hypothetical protein n=1 Tax=Microbispora sp. H11081 TaxID=2729107 RepID=UPI001475B411|nr:hypothetical protein [Microbispora sp. H11081]